MRLDAKIQKSTFKHVAQGLLAEFPIVYTPVRRWPTKSNAMPSKIKHRFAQMLTRSDSVSLRLAAASALYLIVAFIAFCPSYRDEPMWTDEQETK